MRNKLFVTGMSCVIMVCGLIFAGCDLLSSSANRDDTNNGYTYYDDDDDDSSSGYTYTFNNYSSFTVTVYVSNWSGSLQSGSYAKQTFVYPISLASDVYYSPADKVTATLSGTTVMFVNK
jgi:hypothetical protein